MTKTKKSGYLDLFAGLINENLENEFVALHVLRVSHLLNAGLQILSTNYGQWNEYPH